MYEHLLMADLVIADVSTANINAFFELGVRYALRPKTTIVIAEKNFEMGFDMGHVVIRRYEHLGAGIDYDEVERVKAKLTEACRKIPQTEQVDSPVYTFLNDLIAPSRGLNVKTAATLAAAAERQWEERTRAAFAQATTKAEKAALEQPLAALMKTARDARARGDFRSMRDVLRDVRAVQGDKADPYIVQQRGDQPAEWSRWNVSLRVAVAGPTHRSDTSHQHQKVFVPAFAAWRLRYADRLRRPRLMPSAIRCVHISTTRLRARRA
jgi:hypothetical protein